MMKKGDQDVFWSMGLLRSELPEARIAMNGSTVFLPITRICGLNSVKNREIGSFQGLALTQFDHFFLEFNPQIRAITKVTG